MSANITIEQDGSRQHIDAADRFAAIFGALGKGQFLSRTIFREGSTTEIGEIIRVESRSAEHGGWKPWFPVIDYDRCTNCMQCLSFCLFGVYGVDAEKTHPGAEPGQLQNQLPGLFARLPGGGDHVSEIQGRPDQRRRGQRRRLQREKMKVDISALLGGDIYSMLRERSERAQSRFSKERDSDKALNERQKCLIKLAQAGDIPPEVLMSLPSPEEIQRRAEEAERKRRPHEADESAAPRSLTRILRTADSACSGSSSGTSA